MVCLNAVSHSRCTWLCGMSVGIGIYGEEKGREAKGEEGTVAVLCVVHLMFCYVEGRMKVSAGRRRIQYASQIHLALYT